MDVLRQRPAPARTFMATLGAWLRYVLGTWLGGALVALVLTVALPQIVGGLLVTLLLPEAVSTWFTEYHCTGSSDGHRLECSSPRTMGMFLLVHVVVSLGQALVLRFGKHQGEARPMMQTLAEYWSLVFGGVVAAGVSLILPLVLVYYAAPQPMVALLDLEWCTSGRNDGRAVWRSCTRPLFLLPIPVLHALVALIGALWQWTRGTPGHEEKL